MSKSAFPDGTEPLSARDLELLARARAERRHESVPADVRERLFARVLEEAQSHSRGQGAEQSLVTPATELVVMPPRGLAFALKWCAALALGLVLMTQAGGWLRSRGESADGAPLAGEPSPGGAGEPSASRSGAASGAGAATRTLAQRMLSTALFHEPATRFNGPLPAPESSLFGEQPFSPHSRAWQVRRWDDLRASPAERAKYELAGSALCVELGSGERVIGGWPWMVAGEGAASPPPVALAAGTAYRLVFKAWARDPLPAQVLVAIGHDRLPFSAAAGARVEVSTAPQAFALNFVAAYDDPSVGVAFLGTAADHARSRLCLSDVTLTESEPR